MLVSTQSASVSGNYVLVNCEAGEDEPKWPSREGKRQSKVVWSWKALLE